MATIQARKSRGHKYWYIVESRRINGKPRPITLAYLGKADDLLMRLQGITKGIKLKSYSHGAVAALLKTAQELDVAAEINKHVASRRPYMAEKPLRNKLTVGMTLLLGAIGRVCMQTSKRGWWDWAKTTSCSYLLRCSLSGIDSQHFWDLMDSLPVKAIEKIEKALLLRVFKQYDLRSDTLYYDTTNFFTYIHTTNVRCKIAQRGKNKQKRYDLRQIGLALVVSREGQIPIFHVTYQGNRNDAKVFPNVLKKVTARLSELNLDKGSHTFVFDRGNNSKKNLRLLKSSGLYYVGALTPYQHQDLIAEADGCYKEITLDGDRMLSVYRVKRTIWEEERTVLVFVSDQLKAGQIRGIHQALKKKEKALKELQIALLNPRGKKRNREKLEQKIEKMTKGQFLQGLMGWSLREREEGRFDLSYTVEQEAMSAVEEKLGFRILVTNRHEWSEAEIIHAFHGQSNVEHVFRNIKNPDHLALRPQYHWTDQKITVHFFICIVGYLLAALVRWKTKKAAQFHGSLDTLLDVLGNIRLATMIEKSKTRGRVKTAYKLEEMTEIEKNLLEALDIMNFHEKKPRINGVGVYNSDSP